MALVKKIQSKVYRTLLITINHYRKGLISPAVDNSTKILINSNRTVSVAAIPVNTKYTFSIPNLYIKKVFLL